MATYPMHVAGLVRDLPICKVNDELYIGAFIMFGDAELTVACARDLLKKPKILILDDSTSAVDTKTDALIRAGLKKYMPDTTKIIIAQRIASVEDADKIIIMENGTISAIGSHKELLKDNDIYRELYFSQNKHRSETEEGGEN